MNLRLAPLVRLFQYMNRRRKVQLTSLFLLMIIGAFAEMVTVGMIVPFIAVLADTSRAEHMPIIGEFLRWASGSRRASPISAMAGLFVLMAIAAGVIRLVLEWTSLRVLFAIGHDVAVALVYNVMHQPYVYHLETNSSEIIGASTKVRSAIADVLFPSMQSVIACLTAIFILVALLAINLVATLVVLVLAATFYAAVLGLVQSRLRRLSEIYAASDARLIKVLQEGVGSIRDVILGRYQRIFISRYAAIDHEMRMSQVLSFFFMRSPRYVLETVVLVGAASAAYLFIGPGNSIIPFLPVLGALALGLQRLLPLFQTMHQGWVSYASHKQSLSDILQRLDMGIGAEYRSVDLNGRLPFQESIRLENVSYWYSQDRPTAVDNVTLAISKGSRVGIVGKTGSGKSTMIDILMGLLVPSGGRVIVDASVVTVANLSSWRRQISHVPQDIFLLDGTILENIALGIERDQIEMSRVYRASEMAQLSRFVDGLPKKFETVVGERGVQLSGGQKQRIGIARALYELRPLLVLDEATSALDTETEAAIMQSLSDAKDDLTVIMVTHRVRTLERFDRIIVVENGRIVKDTKNSMSTRT